MQNVSEKCMVHQRKIRAHEKKTDKNTKKYKAVGKGRQRSLKSIFPYNLCLFLGKHSQTWTNTEWKIAGQLLSPGTLGFRDRWPDQKRPCALHEGAPLYGNDFMNTRSLNINTSFTRMISRGQQRHFVTIVGNWFSTFGDWGGMGVKISLVQPSVKSSHPDMVSPSPGPHCSPYTCFGGRKMKEKLKDKNKIKVKNTNILFQ